MRRLFIVITCVLFATSASVVSAQTVEQLQQQIAQLLQQVTQLQAAVNAAQGSSGGTTPTPPSTTGTQSCPVLTRNLSVGSEGSDVTKLQQYLAQDPTIYPEGQVSGYYGQLTMRAVQRWQTRYNIVTSGTPDTTGYGAVGPLTRKAFAGCGDILPAQFGGFMRITPVSGNAPLTVSAAVTVNTARSCDVASYRLDFGDGSASFQISVPANRCSELEQTITHTYTNPGTYTASLGIGAHRSTVTVTVGGTGSSSSSGSTNPSCPIAPEMPPSASCVGVWERVYNANGCHTQWRCSGIQPLTVTPNSGATPLTVTASFNVRPGDPYEIVWGDGTTNSLSGTFTALSDLSADSVVLPANDSRVNVQHTFNKTGNFTVNMRHGSYEREGTLWVWRVRQYAGTVNVNGTSVNDGISVATTSGNVPFTAGFVVNINGAGLCEAGTYTVDFGDGSARSELTHPANGCASRTFNITHNYTTAGTYTVRLYKGTSASVTSGTATQVNTLTVTAKATAASSGPFTVTPGSGDNQHTVTASFTLPSGETCNSYELDWGDGSSKVTNTSSSNSCSAGVVTKTFTHTYNQYASATYTITLRREVGALTSSTPTETATVSVTSFW